MYHSRFHVLRCCTLSALCVSSSLWAQVPGEDPLIINKKMEIQMLPLSAQRPSGSLDGASEMPTWLRARVVRYEARAQSADTQGLLTDADVQTSATSQGMQKTCIQEVGSTSTAASSFNRYGPSDTAQVVVLRGDLVNVCR